MSKLQQSVDIRWTTKYQKFHQSLNAAMTSRPAKSNTAFLDTQVILLVATPTNTLEWYDNESLHYCHYLIKFAKKVCTSSSVYEIRSCRREDRTVLQTAVNVSYITLSYLSNGKLSSDEKQCTATKINQSLCATYCYDATNASLCLSFSSTVTHAHPVSLT